MVKVTMNIPDRLYEGLRKQAFKDHVSMTSIVVANLENTQGMKNMDVVPTMMAMNSMGPIAKVGPGVSGSGDVSLEEEFHPVPKK